MFQEKWLQYLFFLSVKWNREEQAPVVFIAFRVRVMAGEGCQYHIKQKERKGTVYNRKLHPPFPTLPQPPSAQSQSLFRRSAAVKHLSIFPALLRRSIAIFLFAPCFSALLCHFFLKRRRGRGGRPSPRRVQVGPRRIK